jgi:hypothetical protein
MRMLRWILGVTLKDEKRNADIRKAMKVSNITDKVREARLRWHRRVKSKEERSSIRHIMEAEVYGHRRQGRPEKRWMDE